jgi:hypothetical protein
MHVFPLLIIPIVLYNVFAFFIFTDYDAGFRSAAIFTVPMVSGARFTFTVSAAIILMALVLLAAELMKATRITASAVGDHVVATAIFVACLLEFLLVRQGATSTFLILTMIALLDLVGGFAVSLRSATRDVNLAVGSGLG